MEDTILPRNPLCCRFEEIQDSTGCLLVMFEKDFGGLCLSRYTYVDEAAVAG